MDSRSGPSVVFAGTVILVIIVVGYFAVTAPESEITSSSITASTVAQSTTVASSSSGSSAIQYPFADPGYLTTSQGCAAGYSTNDTFYAEPCALGGTIGEAIVFDCAAQAASPSGCSVQFSSGNRTIMPPGPPQVINGSFVTVPILSNTITVWNPYVNKTAGEPVWANCMYQAKHMSSSPEYGFCVPLNSTAFVVSGPAVVVPPT